MCEETIESLKKDKLELLQHGVEQGVQISNLEYGIKKFIEWLEKEATENAGWMEEDFLRGVLDKAKEML